MAESGRLLDVLDVSHNEMSSQKRPFEKVDRGCKAFVHQHTLYPIPSMTGRYRSPLTGLRLIKKGDRRLPVRLVSCLAKSSATNYVYPQWEANPAQAFGGE